MASTTTGAAGQATNAAGAFTGLGGTAATTAAAAGKSGAQSALDMGRAYGLAVVFAGIFAGFTLIM